VILTLLTDYGYDDEFVGVCHAVIRSIRPGVPIVDVSHGIARHDVREGAIVLRNTLGYLPVGVHVFGSSGRPMSNTGWPSFYLEEITEHSASLQASVTSLIIEGVFERYPELKIVLIEAGFAWIPSLGWRLDRNWLRMKDEVPHLRRAPSEYLREHFWVSTQPMEEAEEADHVMDAMRWIGFDRILFASDYPHWDFDDPVLALPPSLTEEQRRMIYSGNAKKLYGLS